MIDTEKVKSKDFFLKARNAHWSEPEIHYYLALIEIDLGNSKEAILHLNDTLELNCTHAQAIKQLKKLLRSSKTRSQ